MFKNISWLYFFILINSSVHAGDRILYQSKAFSVLSDKVIQGVFSAKALSDSEIVSDYKSQQASHYSPTIAFKFSINCRDNEMISGSDHKVTLIPHNGECITNVLFGQRLEKTKQEDENESLPQNTRWTIRLDMRPVIAAFRSQGFYTLFNGERLYKNDFKGVYVAGSSLPLIWDFNNLYTRPELQLHDANGDGIFETTLIMNQPEVPKENTHIWKQSKDLSAFPLYTSSSIISDAIYHLSTEEMIKAVEPDSTFRTGKEWAGVWTRDISYSILLSMAYLQPKVAMNSLLRKVKNNRIIQDTGTGGAYPVSTDRVIWAVAAWEVYKATGDKIWLQKAYSVVKNSLSDDWKNIYDPLTGMMKGESSFLDWREQTYPRWMQPADIFESECLGTNAVHYQANKILSQMAEMFGDKATAQEARKMAASIRNGINRYLWIPEKGYYGQYLYGRNHKIVSPRAETLGEALCVLFGIADEERAKTVLTNVPQMDFGTPCIYPQIPNIPPYHNNAVWPFVQTYWVLASAKYGNEASVLKGIADVYRPAALFLTDKENFVASTGDYAGTQINSDNMLWSLSGSLALVHKILFGIQFTADSLFFHPFVPESFDGERTLNNFHFRNASLNISMNGFGNLVKRFELDGKVLSNSSLSLNLEGTHSVLIELGDGGAENQKIHQVPSCVSVETPVVRIEKEKLVWDKVANAKKYLVVKNGGEVALTSTCSFLPLLKEDDEFQVIAVDGNGVQGFASEPVQLPYGVKKINASTFDGVDSVATDGNIVINTKKNTKIHLSLKIKQSGIYCLKFRYSNGSGPVNTDNKCAIRTLLVDGQTAGIFVFPQRGKGEWTNEGFSNILKINLTSGSHILSLIFAPQDENMDGKVNDAVIRNLQYYLEK